MSDDATTPASTWEELKELLRWFAVIFGQPKELCEEQVVRKKHGFVIRGWIAGLEAMARALLMTMAADLPRPNAAFRPARRKGSARPKASARAATPPTTNDILPGVVEVPDSERWADVSFVLIPPRRPERRSRTKPAKLPSSLMRTRPLAYRLEALIRVVERPERYARRLAARLHAKPDLALRLLRQPAPIGCESFPRKEVGRAQGLGWLAWDAFQADTG